MCSARARRCRVQYDVLFIPQLVTHLFVACLCFFWTSCCCCCRRCSCSCCSCNTSYFCIFVGRQKLWHRLCFRVFLTLLEQTTPYIPMFFLRLGPNTTVFTTFLASGSKNHSSYSVFWPVPSKNTGMYAVFSMLQEELFPCQRHKTHCKLQCFGCSQVPKKATNIRQKVPKMDLQKASCNFIVFFSHPGPRKTWKHHQSEGFWGVGGRGAPSGS